MTDKKTYTPEQKLEFVRAINKRIDNNESIREIAESLDPPLTYTGLYYRMIRWSRPNKPKKARTFEVVK